jgi:hypothetical protein
MSLRTRLSFGGVFGTVVAERLLDAVSLFIFLLTLPLVLGRRTPDLISIVSRPVDEMLQNRGIELIVVAILAVGVVAAGAYLLFLKPAGADDHSRLFRALEAFRHGILTLARSRSSVAISVLTLSMWACYVAMAYLPMLIFGFGGANGLGPWDVWAVMLIGSVGIAIPSPGGVGSYHFLTIQALVLIWGIPQETAASYAVFTHGGQMILYIAIGVAIVIVEGISLPELKSAGLRDATAAGLTDPPK